MSIDDFALPWPYPKIELAEGLQLDCSETGLPNASRIGLHETDDDDLYVLRTELINEPRHDSDEEHLEWVTYYGDLIMEFFGLPVAYDWQEREEQYPEVLPITTFEAEEGRTSGLRIWITRAEFETTFRQIASSDFVQLTPEVGIVYASRDIADKDLAWAQDVFRRLYPAIHGDHDATIPETIELRALMGRDLKVEAYGEPDLMHCLSVDFMKSEIGRHGVVHKNWGQWDEGARTPQMKRRKRSRR